MQFRDSPEMSRFRTEVQDFLAAETPAYFEHGSGVIEDAFFGTGSPAYRAAWREWRQRVAARGWIAPAWPREYGGAGLGVLEQFVMNEEFAKQGVPPPGGSGVMMVGPTLIAHGSDAQQREFLSEILSGESVWCQGFSEPGSGSDLASLQTRAVRDGDDYVINGQKIWTSGAHASNWMFCLVRTDTDAPKHRGISYLVLPMDSPGITVQPIVQMTGNAGFNEVFFEDVRVPVRNRIGEENRGWYVGVTTLDFERSGIGAAVGVTQNVQTLAQRAVESGAVGRNAGLRHELVDRAVEASVLTLLSYRVITMQAKGLIPNYEASAAKLFSSELGQRIAQTGAKVGGLYGAIIDPDTPYAAAAGGDLAHDYMATVSSTIAGGTSEVQRNIIATRGLGLPRV